MNCPSCKNPIKLCTICGLAVEDGHGHEMSASFITMRYEEVMKLRKTLEEIEASLKGWKQWNK